MGDQVVAKKRLELKDLKEYDAIKKFLDDKTSASIKINVTVAKTDMVGVVYRLEKEIEGKGIDLKINPKKKRADGKIEYVIELVRTPPETKEVASAGVKPAPVEESAESTAAYRKKHTLDEWLYNILDYKLKSGRYKEEFPTYEEAMSKLEEVRGVFLDSYEDSNKNPEYDNNLLKIKFTVTEVNGKGILTFEKVETEK